MTASPTFTFQLASIIFSPDDPTNGISDILTTISTQLVETDEQVLRQRLAGARELLKTNTSIYNNVDDTKLPKTATTPAKIQSLRATILDVAAFIAVPDDSEFILFGFEVPEGYPLARRSARGVYAAMFAEAVSWLSLQTSPLANEDLNQELDDIAAEIKEVHASISRISQTLISELAKNMRKDAQDKKVLLPNRGQTASRTWKEAYDKTTGFRWNSAENKFAIKEVFDQFTQRYTTLTSIRNQTPTFDEVYDTLRDNDFRTVLALSAWLVPHTQEFFWPTIDTPGFNSWFKEKDGRTMFLEILHDDPTLTGTPLNRTVQFR